MNKNVLMCGGNGFKIDSFKMDEHVTPTLTIEDEYVHEYSRLMFPLAEYGDGLTKKQKSQIISPIRTEPKYQNNEPCICGSGNKYKKCCKNK